MPICNGCQLQGVAVTTPRPDEVEHGVSSPGNAATASGLLREWREGEASAFDRLLPLVYDHLQAIARRQLRRERPGHTLDTADLVHEAYLKLVDQTRVEWIDRSHFFAVATQAMRRILVDHARRYTGGRRPRANQRVTLDDVATPAETRAEILVALDNALNDLAQVDERLSSVVDYRFFAGFTEEETAELLGVSQRTVRRDWIKAKAWLHEALQ